MSLTFVPDGCSVFVFTKSGFGLLSMPQVLHNFVGLSSVVAHDAVVHFLQFDVKMFSLLFP